MDVDTSSPRRSRGITLIEMTTTLAVLAISVGLLAPSWTSVIERNRVTTSANGLLADLRYARNTAVTRGAFISVCPSEDMTGCSGDPFSWHAGYIIFHDEDGDRTRQATEQLLRVREPRSHNQKIQTSAGRPAIRFRPDGAAWSTNATFSVCAGTGVYNRAVVLYGSGRARVDDEKPSGRPIDCD